MDAKLPDLELVRKVQKRNCEKSLKLLIDKHSPLCFEVFKKYLPALSKAGIYPADVFAEKNYLVYKSALSFKEAKNTKFSTWLGNQMRYLCLNALNKNRSMAVSEEILHFHLLKNNPLIKNEDFIKESVDYVFNILSQASDERIKTVFELRYFSDLSNKNKTPWAMVAEKMEVSTQTVINLHNKGLGILKRKMTKPQTRLDEI